MARYEPCMNCGKPVRVDRPAWYAEGETWLDRDGNLQSMGWFPVGPECRKLYPDAERLDPL